MSGLWAAEETEASTAGGYGQQKTKLEEVTTRKGKRGRVVEGKVDWRAGATGNRNCSLFGPSLVYCSGLFYGSGLWAAGTRRSRG